MNSSSYLVFTMGFLLVWTPTIISLLSARGVVAADENSIQLQQHRHLLAAASDVRLRNIGSAALAEAPTAEATAPSKSSSSQYNWNIQRQQQEVFPDYSCNVQTDTTCPFKNNYICDSEVGGALQDVRCENGDCEDCNFYCSDLFENDCVGCLQHGCSYCPGDGKCYNSPHYTTSRNTETGQSSVLIGNPDMEDSSNPYLAFGLPSCTSPEQFWLPPHKTTSATSATTTTTTTTPDFITQSPSLTAAIEAICQPPEFVFRYVLKVFLKKEKSIPIPSRFFFESWVLLYTYLSNV